MATKILLIDPDFIKSITNISDNMQEKFIVPAIREAQDIDLQSVLGSQMLKKLQELVGNNSIESATYATYKELLDTAQYYLAYDVVARLVMISAVHIDNMGPNQGSDDNNNTLNLTDTFKIEDYYNNKRDFYCKRLQEYCLANISSLPELTKAKVNDMHSNLESAASTGVFLGGARGRNKNGYHTHTYSGSGGGTTGGGVTPEQLQQAIATETARTEDTYQHILTAGSNITIEDNVISATGGGSDIPNYYLDDMSAEEKEALRTLIQANVKNFDKIKVWIKSSGNKYNLAISGRAESTGGAMFNFMIDNIIKTYIIERGGNYRIFDTNLATEQWVQNQGYLTEHQSLEGYATEQYVNNAMDAETARTESAYQKVLTAGTGITIENNVISATGGGATRYLISRDTGENYYPELATEIKTLKDAGEYQKLSELIGQISVKLSINYIADVIYADFSRADMVYLWEYDNRNIRMAGYYLRYSDGYCGLNAGTSLATQQWVQNQGYLTEHQDISGKVNNIKGVTGIWTGTQAEYDAIGTKSDSVVYVIK